MSHLVVRCLFILLVATSAADAQRPKVETFTAGSGLPSAVIHDLRQDASGRLWILSRGGVTAYDGRVFRTYASADGLPATIMAALAVDADGGIWTVTRSGIRVFYLAGSTWRGLPEPPGSDRPRNWTSALVVGDRSSVTVGTTADGLQVWNGEAWSRLGVEDGLPSDHVTCLVARGDAVFVGTKAGLCRLDGRGLDCRLGADRRLADWIVALSPAPAAGRLWILAATWLGYLEGGRLTVAVEGLELKEYDPTTVGAVAVGPAGGVYFGSPGRTFFLDPTSGRASRLGLPEGLASEGATALLADRESNVWVGGLRGLSKVSSRRFLSFDREHGLLEDEVSAIAEPAPGRYVLGHNGGITFLDGERVETLAFEPPPWAVGRAHDVQRVLDLAVDREGRLWAAALSLGLLRLEADRTWTAWDLGGQVFAVEPDGRGALWVATGWDLFTGGSAGFSRVETGLDLRTLGHLRWLAAGGEDRLYVATRKGLVWLDGGAWHLARGGNEEADNVYTVLVDSSGAGTVWAGTAPCGAGPGSSCSRPPPSPSARSASTACGCRRSAPATWSSRS